MSLIILIYLISFIHTLTPFRDNLRKIPSQPFSSWYFHKKATTPKTSQSSMKERQIASPSKLSIWWLFTNFTSLPYSYKNSLAICDGVYVQDVFFFIILKYSTAKNRQKIHKSKITTTYLKPKKRNWQTIVHTTQNKKKTQKTQQHENKKTGVILNIMRG